MTAEATRDYRRDGYAHLPRFMAPEVARGVLARLQADLKGNGATIDQLAQANALLRSPAAELYSMHYPPFTFLLWGMTPAVEALVGERLLPTYAYFRLYRQGDICRFHGDRPSCEHSLSLTLAYADDLAWPLEVARTRTDTPYARSDDRHRADEDVAAVAMAAGDAVLYQGVHHHHGRTSPNPNRWSAHLFLHWVARDGAYAAHAFDGQSPPDRIAF